MRLVLFTRYPEAGKAKTRLIPLLGAKGAADVHRRLTENSVKILLEAGDRGDVQVEIRTTGAQNAAFAHWLGNKINFVEQCEGDLTARLLDAIKPAPVLFFGSDTPELSARIVAQAIGALDENDVVIGPAEDGGYYLIGMREPQRELITGMEWSTEKVYSDTIERLTKLGLSYQALPMLSDCDRPEDVVRWPWLTR